MAQPIALCDFEIQLSQVDLDRQASLRLKTARHPSETHERVWLRVLAYCLLYDERLSFGPGLADPDAPDLLITSLTGEVVHWIRVGKADSRKIQRAADRNPKVSVLFESPARLAAFLAEAHDEEIRRLDAVELAAVEPALLSSLAQGGERRAKASVTIVGDHFYIDKDGNNFEAPVTRGRIEP
jgi:uncharacterized protein YaeQ